MRFGRVPLRRIAAALALTAFAFAALMPSGLGEDGDDDARFEKLARRHIAGLTREQRDAAAARNGPLEIRGRTRLSGRILASHIHVAPGADVVAGGDLVLYSTGGILIEAPIRGDAAPEHGPAKGATGKGVRGADGAKGPNIVILESTKDITINANVVGNRGQDGESLVPEGALGHGGNGGKGGDVVIRAKKKDATITINAVVFAAGGGNGGSVDVHGKNGVNADRGEDATATGGNGGLGGNVTIEATHVVFGPGAYVKLANQGHGGEAIAQAGDGGDATECFTDAGDGGDARATGGSNNNGGEVVINAKTLEPASGAQKFVVGAAIAEAAGSAQAIGGNGGNPVAVCDGPCPQRGQRGGAGGNGGDASARGGLGDSGTLVRGSGFLGRDPARVEDRASAGGSAHATGGTGKDGGPGQSAKAPGGGGPGGNSGNETAFGGRGGDCRVDIGTSGLPNHAGAGGDAVWDALNAGNGGPGGNCCNNPNGRGAPGGRAGAAGLQHGVRGTGGKCNGRVDGAFGSFTLGALVDGEDGPDGAGCPGADGLTFSITVVPSPATVGQPVEFRVKISNYLMMPSTGHTLRVIHDKYKVGQPPFVLSTQTVTVPAAASGWPGVTTVSGFGTPPFEGKDQVAEAEWDGKLRASLNFDVAK